MGCVLPAGVGQAPARQALARCRPAAGDGLYHDQQGLRLGMKATMLAHDQILAGGNGGWWRAAWSR